MQKTERMIWCEKNLTKIKSKTVSYSSSEKLRTKIPYLEKVFQKIPTLDLSAENWEEFKNKSESLLMKLPEKTEGQTLLCRDYLKELGAFRNYIRQNFKLVPNGFYLRIFLVPGIVLGLIIGAIFNQIFIASLLGIGLALVIGSFLDKKSAKQNRVL